MKALADPSKRYSAFEEVPSEQLLFGPSQTRDAPSPSGALLSPDSLSLRLPSSASSFISNLGRSTWDFERYAYFRTPRFSLERR